MVIGRVVEGKITPEGIAKLRDRLGAYYHIPRHNTEITAQGIAHYCNGMGDRNPLFLDEEYAKRSRYGSIVAPPTYLSAVAHISGLLVGGLPGVHSFHSGSDWEWFRAVKVGDRITATYRPWDVVEKPSRFAGTMVIVYSQGIFRNQRDEVVARAKGWSIRTERQAARERGKYADLEKPKYTAEQLQAIEEAYDKEVVRGAAPRYWEDVRVGEEVSPIVKGPLRFIDIALGGGGGGGGAHYYQISHRQRHPADAYIDPETGVADHPHRGHWEEYMARQIGVPGAGYDAGPQRCSWLAQFMTNWVGDDGFLKKLYCEFRMFNVEGDTQWFKGKVVRKYVQGREHLVECEIWCENQRGEVTAPGRAIAALPSRTLNSCVPL